MNGQRHPSLAQCLRLSSRDENSWATGPPLPVQHPACCRSWAALWGFSARGVPYCSNPTSAGRRLAFFSPTTGESPGGVGFDGRAWVGWCPDPYPTHPAPMPIVTVPARGPAPRVQDCQHWTGMDSEESGQVPQSPGGWAWSQEACLGWGGSAGQPPSPGCVPPEPKPPAGPLYQMSPPRGAHPGPPWLRVTVWFEALQTLEVVRPLGTLAVLSLAWRPLELCIQHQPHASWPLRLRASLGPGS